MITPLPHPTAPLLEETHAAILGPHSPVPRFPFLVLKKYQIFLKAGGEHWAKLRETLGNLEEMGETQGNMGRLRETRETKSGKLGYS